MVNKKNLDGFRRCAHCDNIFALTSEFFHKDKNRYLGFSYRCKTCSALNKDKRVNRWQEMTTEERLKRKEIQRAYNANGGWRCMRVGAYRYYDTKKGLKCDLTAIWFKENIQNQPCIYCKRTNVRIGCDRIDNKLGHTKDNVVPSCGDCNKCRQDIFTHEEMLTLGPHIALIFINRNWKTTY